MVRLNRINDAMMPTGLFCCKIPVKESDSDETFCTGIYDRESGRL